MPWNIICNKIDTFHETCGTEHDKKGFICMFQDPNVPWNLWMGCSWEQKVVYFLVPTVPGNRIGHKRAYFLVPENRIWQKRVHLYVPRTECSMKLVNGLFPGTETGLFSCSNCSREQNRAQTGVFSCSREQNMTKKEFICMFREQNVPWNLWMGCSQEQKRVYFLVPTVPGNKIGHKRVYFLVPENRIWQKRVICMFREPYVPWNLGKRGGGDPQVPWNLFPFPFPQN